MRRRFLVCGGRDYSDYSTIRVELRKLPRDSIIVTGDAPGADDWALKMAEDLNRHEGYNFWTWRCPADWGVHQRAAGPIRNGQMLEEARPHEGLAFPGGNGTSDMVDRMKSGGLRVVELVGGSDGS